MIEIYNSAPARLKFEIREPIAEVATKGHQEYQRRGDHGIHGKKALFFRVFRGFSIQRDSFNSQSAGEPRSNRENLL
jgi:hypothetical protein